MTRYPDISRSNELFARARRLIPGGTQTLAKGPGQWTDGVAPKYLARGSGCHVWDVDGNEYIDLTMGVGPLSLGYAHPAVDAAIRRQLEDGITFSLMHPLELDVAELIHDVIPGAEMVRFGKNGCDVTTAAVRLARAFTGRDKVLCCGYHGFHDWYVAVTDRDAGVPADVRDLSYTIAYNDLANVEASIDSDTACVILEPMVFEDPDAGFLEGLERICRERGALLIFDEMWTGFRLALGGAQEHFGVTADLSCFSKAVANGMPLSVLTGRADVMSLCDGQVFFYTTFGGEALSLAAGKATLEVMRREPVVEHLARQGKALKDGFNAIVDEVGLLGVSAIGYDSRTLVKLTGAEPLAMKTFVQQEMLARGILWGGFHNVSYAHRDEDVARVLGAYREVVPLLKEALDAGDILTRLRGKQLEQVFRRTERFHTKPVAAQ